MLEAFRDLLKPSTLFGMPTSVWQMPLKPKLLALANCESIKSRLTTQPYTQNEHSELLCREAEHERTMDSCSAVRAFFQTLPGTFTARPKDNLRSLSRLSYSCRFPLLSSIYGRRRGKRPWQRIGWEIECLIQSTVAGAWTDHCQQGELLIASLDTVKLTGIVGRSDGKGVVEK